MKTKKWLTINSKGKARVTHMQPKTDPNEISMLLDINLPDELFRRPRLEAKIDIPKEAALPESISAEVIEDVQQAIKQSTGLTFSISVIKETSDAV